MVLCRQTPSKRWRWRTKGFQSWLDVWRAESADELNSLRERSFLKCPLNAGTKLRYVEEQKMERSVTINITESLVDCYIPSLSLSWACPARTGVSPRYS